MKKIFMISLLAVIFSCVSEKSKKDCNNYVTILNSSNKVIYFGGIGGTPTIGYNPLNSGDYFRIPIGTSKKDPYGRDRGCYEDLFTENNNKLYYLFYDEQVLLNNTWEDVVSSDLVLKRYSFTLKEMQDANWTINYNGN